MATGADKARAFLESRPEPRRDNPMPRRRFNFNLFFPFMTAGGLAFLVHQCLNARDHPLPKPGPRRYPPGYHRPEQPAGGKEPQLSRQRRPH